MAASLAKSLHVVVSDSPCSGDRVLKGDGVALGRSPTSVNDGGAEANDALSPRGLEAFDGGSRQHSEGGFVHRVGQGGEGGGLRRGSLLSCCQAGGAWAEISLEVSEDLE